MTLYEKLWALDVVTDFGDGSALLYVDRHLADPQFEAREALVEVESPRWGRFMRNSFPKLSETSGGIRRLAPTEIGQHNDPVYRELPGFNEGKMERMQAAGTI